MDESGIIAVCEGLGLDFGRPYPGSSTWGPHISISCPLAPATHGDPFDSNTSCSVQINPAGPSGARCFSGNCNYKGSLLRLIRSAVRIRGENPELKKILDAVRAVEEVTIEGALKIDRARIEAQAEMMAHAEARRRMIQDRDVIPEETFESFWGKIPQYAQKRGISISSARRWGLGYDEDLKYLVFPVRRRDNKLVGLVGRSVLKEPLRRHHNYVGLDKAKHLFGAQLLEHGKPIVVVEGCTDAIRVDQALLGDACVVASLGEGFSQNHAKTIQAMRPPWVYIFTDGDAAGRAMGSKIHYALNGLVPLKLMECPWGPFKEDGTRKKVDPAELPVEFVQHLFRTAKIIRDRVRWTEPPPIFDAATWKAA